MVTVSPDTTGRPAVTAAVVVVSSATEIMAPALLGSCCSWNTRILLPGLMSGVPEVVDQHPPPGGVNSTRPSTTAVAGSSWGWTGVEIAIGTPPRMTSTYASTPITYPVADPKSRCGNEMIW